MFRELVHRVLEKIKNEPYFKWPNKMAGESTRRNQNFYYQYHQNHGGLQKPLKLPGPASSRRKAEAPSASFQWSSRPNPLEAPERYCLRPPVGTINVILAAPGRTGTRPSRVLSVAQLSAKEPQPEPKRAKMNFHPTLSISEEDKIGTTQPYDDALLITLRIREYDVKRVMVDSGNAAEVMYPDLYKGLNLKLEDLMPYSSPLMSFDGKLVIPKGMIRLPIQTGLEIVEVNFIVVDTYSPYTTIVGRPWLHTLGAVASSLHQKVKFPSED